MSAPTRELALAERAMNHLTHVVDSLVATDLDRPTPCPDWTVRELLAHVAGTAAALADFARTGRRQLPDKLVPLADPTREAVASIAGTRAALLDDSGDPDVVRGAAGDVAIEFTTHAWDLDPGQAIPEDLATDVLVLVSPLMNDELRQQFFAAQADVGPGATVSDKFVAFLGRDPAQPTNWK
jgi:uncharacterized Actinobacterial protein TIGR03083